jgi:hypothetical protein
LTIQSNSRDLAPQIAKDKFPRKYGAPLLYKYAKAEKEEIIIDAQALAHHRWQLQDELIDIGATFDGSGKIFITIPKGKHDDRVKEIMGLMRRMYGFNSKASQDDDSFYIETSEYVFTKHGLDRFLNECKGG